MSQKRKIGRTRGKSRAGRLASGGAIREAAATLFLERGYAGTSMDDIAARAAVSKQTIYTHFQNKEELFADLVLGNAGPAAEFSRGLRDALVGAPSIQAGLREVARRYVRQVSRKEVLRLRRLVIGESGRFPEVARTYYERVPHAVVRAMTAVFAELTQSGRLKRTDPKIAAEHFAWLCVGAVIDFGMFHGDAPSASAKQVDAAADAAVHVFLAAYGA